MKTPLEYYQKWFKPSIGNTSPLNDMEKDMFALYEKAAKEGKNLLLLKGIGNRKIGLTRAMFESVAHTLKSGKTAGILGMKDTKQIEVFLNERKISFTIEKWFRYDDLGEILEEPILIGFKFLP